jgi:hypothetical protein
MANSERLEMDHRNFVPGEIFLPPCSTTQFKIKFEFASHSTQKNKS